MIIKLARKRGILRHAVKRCGGASSSNITANIGGERVRGGMGVRRLGWHKEMGIPRLWGFKV